MRVVADTSPLIALARIGHLDLLSQLYRTIWIPPAVRRELLRGSPQLGWPTPLRDTPWIRVSHQPIHAASQLVRANLGAGESEVLGGEENEKDEAETQKCQVKGTHEVSISDEKQKTDPEFQDRFFICPSSDLLSQD